MKNTITLSELANKKEFLNFAAKNRRVVNCTYEMPKSFVVCLDKDFTETVYISQMSCATLLKRSKIKKFLCISRNRGVLYIEDPYDIFSID